MNILLGMTGSVATTLHNKIIKELNLIGEVKVIGTEMSEHFMTNPPHTFKDKDEWDSWKYKKEVLHIELAKWADIMVIAPLSANTLAKLANGICDNLLTCTFRAWVNKDNYPKPIIVAPAMNTHMWEDGITDYNIMQIAGRKKVIVVPPIIKTLACGDHGTGAMAKIEDIAHYVKHYKWSSPLDNFSGIPTGNHLGSFAAVRKHDIHIGVDLYVDGNEPVMAVEDGVLVDIDTFTGASIGSSWWNETKAVVVKGASGYIVYGEIEPLISRSNYCDNFIAKGQVIGKVIPVLPDHKKRPDILGHSNYMLHFEWLSRYPDTGSSKPFSSWKIGNEKSDQLLDPTRRLFEFCDKELRM